MSWCSWATDAGTKNQYAPQMLDEDVSIAWRRAMLMHDGCTHDRVCQ
jgi:hypothetical protein